MQELSTVKRLQSKCLVLLQQVIWVNWWWKSSLKCCSFSLGCTLTRPLKGRYDEALFASDGLAVFSAGTASHGSNNKAESGLSSAVSLNRVTAHKHTGTVLFLFSSSLVVTFTAFGHFTYLTISSPSLQFDHGKNVISDQWLSLLHLLALRHLPSPALMPFSSAHFDAHNQSQECTVTLSITILLQKLNSSSLSFAMLGAYNNTVKNPDPEKIVKQISTMLSQHSVIHAVTLQHTVTFLIQSSTNTCQNTSCQITNCN